MALVVSVLGDDCGQENYKASGFAGDLGFEDFGQTGGGGMAFTIGAASVHSREHSRSGAPTLG